MTDNVLVDTGPLVAIISARGQQHSTCVAQAKVLSSPLVTCWPVITEAAWLLRSHPQYVQRLLSLIDTGGLDVVPLMRAAARWIADFMNQYQDLRPQLADVALMYLSETRSVLISMSYPQVSDHSLRHLLLTS